VAGGLATKIALILDVYPDVGYNKHMITRVHVSPRARKQLKKAPPHIVVSFARWSDAVEEVGLLEVRRRPGYHDEPLRGTRSGQRSIRLSRKWRAIYVITDGGEVEFISVEEVTPHDY
jgi:proteic killer suppression protein